MNELKEKLMTLGLGDEMADQVLATVVEFAKSKVPAAYRGMVDDLLRGQSPELQGILGSLGIDFP
jgi:hypothetical protein